MDKVIRAPYGIKERVVKYFNTESMTKQSHKEECDINTIMKKYLKTGVIMHGAPSRGSYIDLPDEIDFHTAQNYIIKAQEAFMEIPAHLRKRFNNDPGEFVDFVENPDNYDELIRLGLARPKPSGDQTLLDVTGPTDTNPATPGQPEGE